MLSRDSLQLELVSTMAMESQHHIQMHDKVHGITSEIVTNKKEDGSFGKSQTFYFIQNDEREFLTMDEVIDACNEKFKFEGENPETEIKYVKVYAKRDAING